MKIQKIISVFLAFFLFVSNIGLAMNVHYCGDEIASISMNAFSNAGEFEKNCCGSVEKQSHCCSDKVVHFEKKTDQATIFTLQIDVLEAAVFSSWKPILNLSPSFDPVKSNSGYSFQSNAPPLFKLNSQYIFYDRV